MAVHIVVFGAGGQVGQSLQRAAASAGRTLAAIDRAGADITNTAAIDAALDRAAVALPQTVVINAAAYTAVDRAETERERAFAVNRDGAGLIAAACRRRKLPLIHLSTDYVFDGATDRPWREDDATAPLNQYGLSKLAGEVAVRTAHADAVVLRTAWVYSPFGSNFIKTMLQLATNRRTIDVVDDQIGSPTAGWMIAEALMALTDRLADAGAATPFGIYHFAGAGAVSRFTLAQAVFAEAARHG